MLTQPLLAALLAIVVLLSRGRPSLGQYSSDQCSWKGSGLTHEGHTRDVEQVYLRCSQGSLEWLYPTGAVIVNLRPNTVSPAAARLSVCVKPAPESSGTNVYLDLNGRLRLLLRERDQALGKTRCFGILEGALFIEAVPRADISRRVTAFRYELVSDVPGSLDGSRDACQPCSDDEVLLAVCTKDFVARGVIRSVQEEAEEDRSSVSVDVTRLYRQKTQVFVPAGPRGRRRWSGRIMMPLRCGIKAGEGDFLFTGTLRFGEAWMGCAPRYKDFLRSYKEAERLGTNPCHVDPD
ncbi:meteorin-like protein [Syngnathoides biaculeatus]|uniref:meteorin-like protein n=1 Tax=Syngnathoides biaculeatus TaxID=300417 RepID=UPI002ADE7473|nr:meteorin-like protein [Syngnathoides biaculeatus]